MKKKLYLKIGIGVVAVVLVTCVLFFIMLSQNTKPVSEESNQVQIVVDDGETYNSILDRLEEENVIRSAFYTKLKGMFRSKPNLEVGVYTFDKAWSSDQVLDELDNPNLLDTTITVTLVEGGWAKDFAKQLALAFNKEEQEFIDLWNDVDYIKELQNTYSILDDDVLNSENKRILLEGFIYPDTYNFYMDATVKEITERILDNTQEKLEPLLSKNTTQYSNYEILTLSSIVEYEANVYEDMQNIAGVFYNRLSIDMPLQSSVTVCYALYEFEDWTECENQSPDNPYNTYKEMGLPPGPILNPSARAVEATLDYIPNDYFYFLADVYGDGSVYFQTTYSEHETLRKELLGY